jgi:CubicO group peptidase (beta-lactamase class C family)
LPDDDADRTLNVSMLPRLCRVRSAVPLIFALVTGPVFADLIDDTIETILARRNIPGMSIAVIDGGRIVKAQGYGVLEFGRADRVTPDTLFQAASISKPVSALGALRLVDEGKLSLDADINSVLTSWRVPENEFTKDQKVTLRRILAHHAGLTVSGFGGYGPGQPVPSLPQILDGLPPANSGAVRVNAVPGTVWRYSGGGYTVLQQAMIDASGRPFADYMQQAVLDPLGMRASRFDQPLSPQRSALAAHGYSWPRHPMQGGSNTYPELAAAGLWTTPSDLARFAIGIQESLAGRSNPVISAERTREMLTRQMHNSSLGFAVHGGGRTQRFEHGGRNGGFDSYLTAYLEQGKGAIVMMNANDRNGRTFKEVLNAVAIQYNWPDYQRLPWFEPMFSFYEDYSTPVHGGIGAVFLLVIVATWRRVKRRRRVLVAGNP